MQLPLQILQLGELRVDRTEKTRDISSGGVSFLSPVALDIGERVEYVVTLTGNSVPVRIHCLGKVLRSRQIDAQEPRTEHTSEFEVAVTLERYQFVRSDQAAH